MRLACKEKLVRNFQEVDRLSLDNFQERIDVITFTVGRQVATRELIMNMQDLPVTSNTESNIEKQLHFEYHAADAFATGFASFAFISMSMIQEMQCQGCNAKVVQHQKERTCTFFSQLFILFRIMNR